MSGHFSSVGVISDTHGLLRPEAVAALRGVDWILHAGDFDSAELLETVRALAPAGCFAGVRGNVDRGAWAQGLPEREWVELGGKAIYLVHDLQELDLQPAAAGISVVISGHSHQPRIERRADGVLYLNPGSAGPRRFRLPVTLAFLTIDRDGTVDARIQNLL
jgi:putative phosphoesterase